MEPPLRIELSYLVLQTSAMTTLAQAALKVQIKQKEAQRKHYLVNKPDYLSKNQKRRADRKEWYHELMSTKCCIKCGESTFECLDWHHVDPKQKDGSVPVFINEFRSMKQILNEMSKCVILCANCHRKFHAGNLNITELVRVAGFEPAI